jgi:hypothetical protein
LNIASGFTPKIADFLFTIPTLRIPYRLLERLHSIEDNNFRNHKHRSIIEIVPVQQRGAIARVESNLILIE